MTGSEKALPRNTRMSNLIVNKRKGKKEEEKEHLDGFTLMCFAWGGCLCTCLWAGQPHKLVKV